MRVCLVGFDEDSARSITLALRLRWPNLEGSSVTPECALEQIDVMKPDVIFFTPAGARSQEVMPRLRRMSDAAIVTLAAEPGEAELIEMLEAGADDYLGMRASVPLLVARVSATLRRAQKPGEDPGSELHCGELRIDPLTYEAAVNGQGLHLTPTEFKLLCHLTENKGRLATHESLQNLLWGAESRYYAHCLRKYVQRLRQKIEACGDHNANVRIVTVPRIGYKLVEAA